MKKKEDQTMKVILLSDVKKVGKKGEVKEVSDGYARNFLIARNLAVPYSEGSKKVLAKQEADKQREDEEKRYEAKLLKEQIEPMTFEFPVKSKDGNVFGSISTKQIAEKLKDEGFTIDKRKILDNEPIKELGVTNVRVELYKDVIATISVRLTEE